MTTYSADPETGKPLCPECSIGACHGNYICEAEHCECWCRTEEAARERRAAEMDDRPADKLHVIANELDRERTGELADLTAERFGRPTRSRA